MICSRRHTHKKVSMQLFSFQYSLHWWVTPTSYYISRSYVGQQYWQSRPKIQFRLEYKVGNSNTWLILNCYSISFSIIPVSKYVFGEFLYVLEYVFVAIPLVLSTEIKGVWHLSGSNIIVSVKSLLIKMTMLCASRKPNSLGVITDNCRGK